MRENEREWALMSINSFSHNRMIYTPVLWQGMALHGVRACAIANLIVRPRSCIRWVYKQYYLVTNYIASKWTHSLETDRPAG